LLHVDEGLIDRITEAFYWVLKGRAPPPVEIPADLPDNEVRQLLTYVNRFLGEYRPIAMAMKEVSEGRLEAPSPPSSMSLAQSYKALQSNLRHLTWKTQQIAAGRLEERVDFMGEFSQAFNAMTQQLKDSFEAIRLEREKSERLLLNVLPAKVAEELKETGRSEPQSFEEVTVLFTDVVDFTRLSARVSPRELIEELNTIFTHFDEVMEARGCERIKSIGDAYLAVCGMPEPNPDHARSMVAAACEILRYMQDRKRARGGGWDIRVGIHSGRLVGGIVGIKKYIYDVFGDTINTASRMETYSEPMRINVSETTYALVKDDFAFVPREPAEVKGKGRLRMYFVDTSPAP
jgi:class 3 adenylate cyclase